LPESWTFAIRVIRRARLNETNECHLHLGGLHTSINVSLLFFGWKGLRLIRFSFQSCHTAPSALATVVCVCVDAGTLGVCLQRCHQIDSMNHGKDNIDTQRSSCFTLPAVRQEAGPTSQSDGAKQPPPDKCGCILRRSRTGQTQKKDRVGAWSILRRKGLGQKSFGCPLVKEPDRGECGREDGCPSLQVTHSLNRIAPYSGGDDNVAGIGRG